MNKEIILVINLPNRRINMGLDTMPLILKGGGPNLNFPVLIQLSSNGQKSRKKQSHKL